MPLLVQLQEREDFEKRTLLALAGAAALSPVLALTTHLYLPVNTAWLALLGAGIASTRGGWKTRLAMGVGLMVGLTVIWQVRAPAALTQFCMGLLAAGAVDLWRVARRPYGVLAGMVGAGALVPLGMYVKAVLDARLFSPRPGMVSALVGLTVVALFWGVGRLASYVRVHGNKIEARGAALEGQLTGEAQGLVMRTVKLHKECRREVGRMEAGPGRKELTGVLDKLATGVFTLAEEYAELLARLQGARAADVSTQVQELRAKAAAATDAVARRQLELAASSLGEELNHLDVLDRKRERLLAQLHAQVALVERARVSLVGARGGDAAAKGAQAAHLAQRLAELGQEDAGTPRPQPDSSRVVS
ncbi:hypothetical protein CYFUS_000298 [Cystobacter fuscus]|uniref:Uncharacterized protein n=1 Tax=Cystobacter fuscus TaxID=43 RepID=A0A250IUQ8_9BACT|nr:hypothetical protein [Cystobacter fuscus]ATB34891.1 hypothetical protein CYFUS_000298 [Cystobacter fuscus]